MSSHLPQPQFLDSKTRAFYCHAMTVLNQARVPFLVGGAYALKPHAGIERHTKDFDVFVRPGDSGRALEALAAAGYATELTFSHWLGKAFCRDAFVDVIFSSGNGICQVDDGWFAHAPESEVLGIAVQLVPAEELIWSKSFVMERERFDGADIAHIFRACGPVLDWKRLLDRFRSHERVLLAHVLLFGFIYPGEKRRIPYWVEQVLWESVQHEKSGAADGAPVCRGTVLSREQYLIDIQEWGYHDARLPPQGSMSPEAIAQWTAGIDWNKRV